MRRLKSKVKLVRNQKTDGRFNFGTIVGIELTQDAYYLGYISPTEYLNRFKVPRYKVAYIDCVTQRAQTDWFDENEVGDK